jgi:hypothetical protein
MGEVNKATQLGPNAAAAVDICYMYYLKSQPWLPHYTEKGVFVAPGGVEKKEIELQVLGAVKREAVLWPRPWIKEKSRLVR